MKRQPKRIRRKRSFFILLPLLAVILASCSSSNQHAPGNNSLSPAPSQTASPNVSTDPPTLTPSPEIDPIRQQVEQMSLDEKIGQLVIVGLDGYSMNDDTLQMIEQYKVGGFILFKNNIDTAEQTVSLLNQLKEANKKNAVPLWLSVDQEGGRVSRLSSMFSNTPSAGEIGAADDLTYTRNIGRAIGNELHALGFNMDFAPVMDINSNPKNPVIGDRSFGSTPEAVMKHGIETMYGINSQGVAAVIKHFPGHGDTSVDSHYDLPLVNKTRQELEQFELQPFIEAINQDVDAIMVAHLLMMQIDDKQPASISSSVINGLLRDQLGYDGVVITDDMTMGALLNTNKIGDAAVRSILAGTDIVLVSHQTELRLEVIHSLKAAVESNTLNEQRIDESLYRILRLKQKYSLQDAPTPSPDIDQINKNINDSLQSRS
ncbi:beta-N-acetylhexosaminidase [Paenibacillus nanensis]|uniref:Beta-N-acetylhexosaminidase n=2 Tax=Paenibacillus nanensis TaxID=393251 RepID=A0A3A1V988_9BACL|nr:beta-N-acetylhexosaminidase [Paenibacillus nanensis]